ncbi:hypothetical protein SBA4_3090005 [Candidatus Sulfopaludibacter sp. SbA4]|nr:hypothetical protein SBA4_3090005 [Candidatus Sulfopaludibacter sp. SbA4]
MTLDINQGFYFFRPLGTRLQGFTLETMAEIRALPVVLCLYKIAHFCERFRSGKGFDGRRHLRVKWVRDIEMGQASGADPLVLGSPLGTTPWSAFFS